MKSNGIFVIFLFSLSTFSLSSQNHQARWAAMDVEHYRFHLEVNDMSDVIRGHAEIRIRFTRDAGTYYLDLEGQRQDGKGMTVKEAKENGQEVLYSHIDNRLQIKPAEGIEDGDVRILEIKYEGIPADGLIISENKYGDRTFFGDNWPNRARHWLPSVDHPSDKATVEFIVEAPSHYGIVAIGQKIAERKQENRQLVHWQSTVPLPTKLMVVGISPFSVQYLKSSSGVPVSSWVYPQNEKEGFYDYGIATRPLDFFEHYIAPYPYEKLANVQSKTRYGGMENAGCIFYHERSVTGRQDRETLLAHEIAHQWFGDAVSEFDWHHIWLSEGFATYLTDVYLEETHGREVMRKSLKDERRQVIEFSKRRMAPIIDTTLSVSVKLLNANCYEKAGWTLHMLRHEMGDEDFQTLIRTFYRKYKFRNALTDDVRWLADSISGRDFEPFFRQWFYQPGHPVLDVKMDYRKGEIILEVSQVQEGDPFFFPLDVSIELKNGTVLSETFRLSGKQHSFKVQSAFAPHSLTLDPDTRLLFEATK